MSWQDELINQKDNEDRKKSEKLEYNRIASEKLQILWGKILEANHKIDPTIRFTESDGMICKEGNHLNQCISFVEPSPEAVLYVSPHISVVSGSKIHDGVHDNERMEIFYDRNREKFFGWAKRRQYAIDESTIDIVLKNVYMNHLPHTGLKSYR
jgi:hypothetical protein